MKLIFIGMAAAILFQFPEVKMVKTKVGKSISVEIPSTFRLLGEDEVKRKFVSARLPVASFTSEDGKADFAVNILGSGWSGEDLPLLQRFYSSQILNLYDSVHFSIEEIRTINKREFIVFEFISVVNPEENAIAAVSPLKRFNYIQYALINGKTVVFAFSSPTGDKAYWHEIAGEIMGSVEIKKTL